MNSFFSVLPQVTQDADYSWTVDQIITNDYFLDFVFIPLTVKVISAGLFKVLYAPGTFDVGLYRQGIVHF
jgi:hypothetical protein